MTFPEMIKEKAIKFPKRGEERRGEERRGEGEGEGERGKGSEKKWRSPFVQTYLLSQRLCELNLWKSFSRGRESERDRGRDAISQ
jgi:hypothetical protein